MSLSCKAGASRLIAAEVITLTPVKLAKGGQMKKGDGGLFAHIAAAAIDITIDSNSTKNVANSALRAFEKLAVS